MRIPNYFSKWFRIFGLMDDGWDFELWQSNRVKKIAWRAYRKGVADTKAKHEKSISKEVK